MKKSTFILIGTLNLLSAFCLAAGDEETVFHKQVREKMPALASFARKGSRSWDLLDKDGKKLGSLHLENIDDSQRKKGYKGPIEVAIVLNANDEICGVLIGKNQETPRFLKRVQAAGFLEKWNGMALQKAAETDMGTVSRATYSSSAIAYGVRKLAASLLGEETEKH